MLTIMLLLASNAFMTFAWYGHLKHRSAPVLEVVIVSWLIAFGEYCFQVPANRIGYGRFTAYQLKIIQECLTLLVFVVFAYFYLARRYDGITPSRFCAFFWRYCLVFGDSSETTKSPSKKFTVPRSTYYPGSRLELLNL